MYSGVITVSLVKRLIGDELNTTILVVFLWGIYIIVYAGTLCLYLTRKNQAILWAISLSYGAYASLTILTWYLYQSAVVNHSETRDVLFAALYEGSQSPDRVAAIMIFILPAVADGILIWRYHVCDKSFRAILIPGLLLFSEIVIVLAAVGMSIRHLNAATESQIDLLDRLLATQALITWATTQVSIPLIAYQIYAAPRKIPANSKRLLVRIFDILGQSAAAYFLVGIGILISTVVPQTTSNEVSSIAAISYTTLLFIFISGVAPTVLVARVAILDENDVNASSSAIASGSSHLSGLQLHVRTTQGDDQSQPQLPDGMNCIERSVEGPQVSEVEKENGNVVNIP